MDSSFLQNIHPRQGHRADDWHQAGAVPLPLLEVRLPLHHDRHPSILLHQDDHR